MLQDDDLERQRAENGRAASSEWQTIRRARSIRERAERDRSRVLAESRELTECLRDFDALFR